MSVRDMIATIQEEARSDAYTPSRAADSQRKLAALLGNVNREIRVREMEYKRFRLMCYQSEKAASRAKMISEVSPEFESWQEAQHLKQELIELMRSLKLFLSDAHEERRYSGHQT